MMSRKKRIPVKKSRIEPLFIRFANFKFSVKTVDAFFKFLKDAGIEVPLEELFLYYRIEDEEFANGSPSFTEDEKEKISKDLESERQRFRSLLIDLTDKGNFEGCLEVIISHYTEIPLQFTHHKKDFEKLAPALPSLQDIETIDWPDFIPRLMAVTLAEYVISNPVTKIKLCKNNDCEKFFTRRRKNAIYCSGECQRLFDYISRRDSGYYRDFMKDGRKEGKYK